MVMNILGVNDFSGHDVSAALVSATQEGLRIVGASDEERFSNRKHHPGFYNGGTGPDNTLRWLRDYGPVDSFALAWDMDMDAWRHHKTELLKVHHACGSRLDERISAALRSIRDWSRRRTRSLETLEIFAPVTAVPHHRAHASLSYRTSPYDEALVVVMDGAGEAVSTSVFMGRGNTLTELANYPISQSLGTAYSIVTELLGFEHHNEGKTMGLAPYGEPMKEPLLTYDVQHDEFRINTERISELQRYNRKPAGRITLLHKDIAATLQANLTTAVLRFVEKWVSRTGCRTVCLGGGITLNCKTNGELYRSGVVDKMFVPPASNDSGTSLGAALEQMSEIVPQFALDVKRADFGYRAEDVKGLVELEGRPYEQISRPELRMVDDILSGRIIAVYNGAAEFGPRALGHRSILADPSDKTVVKRLNSSVKRRECWRPYGVMLLAEDTPQLFGRAYDAPFMNLAVRATPLADSPLGGVIHVDGSVRIQTVDHNQPFQYRLLQEMKRRTGWGAVVNTSLNPPGRPIANPPADAFCIFDTTGIDALYVDDFRTSKKA